MTGIQWQRQLCQLMGHVVTSELYFFIYLNIINYVFRLINRDKYVL